MSKHPHASERRAPRVFVTGDLNFDHIYLHVELGQISPVVFTPPRPGGSAYNAAQAFKRGGFFEPLVFGKVGQDRLGDQLITHLNEQGIAHVITRSDDKATCVCNILRSTSRAHPRTVFYYVPNANDYDVPQLQSALNDVTLGTHDYTFFSLHCVEQTQCDWDRCRRFVSALRASRARLIIDVVPHNIYNVLGATAYSQISDLMGGRTYLLIGEHHTFMNLIDPGSTTADGSCVPTRSQLDAIAQYFPAQHHLVRHGFENCTLEIHMCSTDGSLDIQPSRYTGYKEVPDIDKGGFGDILTNRSLHAIHQQP